MSNSKKSEEKVLHLTLYYNTESGRWDVGNGKEGDVHIGMKDPRLSVLDMTADFMKKVSVPVKKARKLRAA